MYIVNSNPLYVQFPFPPCFLLSLGCLCINHTWLSYQMRKSHKREESKIWSVWWNKLTWSGYLEILQETTTESTIISNIHRLTAEFQWILWIYTISSFVQGLLPLLILNIWYIHVAILLIWNLLVIYILLCSIYHKQMYKNMYFNLQLQRNVRV